MTNNMKNKVKQEISRAANASRLKEVLNKAFNKGYITEMWFTDAFEKQCKFVKVNSMIDEMNQSIKEFNGETTTTVNATSTPTQEAEALHVEVEDEIDDDKELDNMNGDAVDKMVEAIPLKEKFTHRLGLIGGAVGWV